MKKLFIGFIVLLFLVQACASPTLEPASTFAPMGTAVSVTEARSQNQLAAWKDSEAFPVQIVILHASHSQSR